MYNKFPSSFYLIATAAIFTSHWQHRLRLLVSSLLIGAALAVGTPDAAAQTPQWLFDGQRVDFRATTPGSTVPPTVSSTTAAHSASVRDFNAPYHHAAYDELGNLAFYVDGRDFKKPDGTPFGVQLPRMWNFDLELIPRPGSCTQYFVVYGGNQGGGTNQVNIVYDVLDVSTWTTVGPSTTLIVSSTQPFGTYVPFYYSIATSGLRADGTRRLYVVAENQVRGFIVSASGITVSAVGSPFDTYILPSDPGVTPYISGTGLLGRTTDAEVSADGRVLAYSLLGPLTSGAATARVVYVRLNDDGNIDRLNPNAYPAVSAVVTTEGGIANGVTFNPLDSDAILFTAGKDNSTIGNNGVFWADFSTTTSAGNTAPVTFGANTKACAQSDINAALDGRVYASNATTLRPINYPVNSGGGSVSLGSFGLSVTLTTGSFGQSSGTPTVRLFPTQINGKLTNPAVMTGLVAYSAYVHIAAPTTVNVAGGNQTVTVSTPDITGRTYFWSISGATGATITSGQGTPGVTINVPQSSAPATLTVSLATNAACSVTRTRSISIINNPGCGSCERTVKPDPKPLAAYPNPAADRITIAGAATDEAALVNSLTGQRMPIRLTNGNTEASVAHLPDGLYWLEVRAAETVRRERIIVKH